MHQLAAMVRESIRHMSPEEKAEARKYLDAAFGRGRFTAADREFLRQIGITDPCSRNALASPLEPATASGDASPL
jgi:hypothetical protein